MRILKVRKLRLRYYVLLSIVLIFAIWSNLKFISMENITCLTTGGGICAEILLYTIFKFISYGSIILFALMLIYIYLFNSNNVKDVETEVSNLEEIEVDHLEDKEKSKSQDII